MDPLENLWATRLKHLDYKAEHSYGDAKLTLQGASAELRQCLLDLKTHFPEKGNATEQRMFIKLELENPEVLKVLGEIKERVNKMPTQAEEAAILRDFVAQLAKAKEEILAKIAALEKAVADAGVTSAEVDAATAEAKTAAKALDDIGDPNA